MIEVEKKFQPTEEQMQALLKDSEFIKEVEISDFYYDYPDYSLWKNRIFFRKRNEGYELKVGVKDVGGAEGYEEIEDEEKIKKYFGTTKSITEFIKDGFIIAVDFKTNRLKYKNGRFNIDVDDLSFGYKCIEIELLVDHAEEVSDAYAKIIELAKQYGFDVDKKVVAKRKEYFRIVKPDVYNELYG